MARRRPTRVFAEYNGDEPVAERKMTHLQLGVVIGLPILVDPLTSGILCST